MSRISKLIWLIALLLLVPLASFLVWNEPLELAVRTWAEANWQNPWRISAATVVLLTVDLLLPIPSSVVSVLTARSLTTAVSADAGLALAVGVVWLGMTLGALLAWGLGRLGGEALVRRFVGERDFQTLRSIGNRYGAFVLVLLRAVPLFAEASVLILSLSGVRFWRTFFLPVALSNLGIALIYCLLGHSENGLPLWIVVLASIVLPALVTLITRKFLGRSNASENTKERN